MLAIVSIIGIPVFILLFIVLIGIEIAWWALVAAIVFGAYAIIGSDGLQAIGAVALGSVGCYFALRYLNDQYFRPMWRARFGPDDPTERYLWENRLGPYADRD